MHIGWLNTDGCSNCSDACVCLLCHGNHSAIGGGRNSRNLTISCHTRQERSDPNPQRLSRVHDLLQCFGLIWTESSDAGFALPLYLLRICKSNKWGSNRPSMTNKMHKHFQLEREALSTRTFDEPKFAYKGRYDWYWLIMIDRNIMEYSLVPSSVCVPFHGHILPTLCQVFTAFLFCHRGGCQIMIQAVRRPWFGESATFAVLMVWHCFASQWCVLMSGSMKLKSSSFMWQAFSKIVPIRNKTLTACFVQPMWHNTIAQAKLDLLLSMYRKSYLGIAMPRTWCHRNYNGPNRI